MAKNLINKIDFDFSRLGFIKQKKDNKTFLEFVSMDIRNVLVVSSSYFVKDSTLYTTTANPTFNGDFDLMVYNHHTKSEEIINISLDILELMEKEKVYNFHIWDYKLKKYIFIEKKEVKNNLTNY